MQKKEPDKTQHPFVNKIHKPGLEQNFLSPINGNSQKLE